MPFAMTQPLIIIPARMASSRLPGKPLADICGRPMIVRVWECAVAAQAGRVAVAAAENEVAEAITGAGGEVVMTDPDLPSGSDRVWAAVEALDPKGAHDTIVNLQGDMPYVPPAALSAVLDPFAENIHYDIATLAARIRTEEEDTDPSVVKAVISLEPGAQFGPALYFTRATAPTGQGPRYHHVGIYAYRRAALERFVNLEPSALEIQERLEQLRALEAGMRIGVALVDEVPISVDTPEDLERARQAFTTPASAVQGTGGTA